MRIPTPIRFALVATLMMTSSALIGRAQATINVFSSGNSGATQAYATTFFTVPSVQAGDILVVAHAPNKRTTSNTITATATGLTFSSLNSGDSGAQSAAWIFWTSISSSATNVAISLDTNSATKTNSNATSYFVLRPSTSGYNLAVLGAGTGNAASGTSLPLSFSNTGGYVDTLMIGAAAIGTTTLVSPAGWTEVLDRGPDKRVIYSYDPGDVSSFSGSVTSATTDSLAAAGIVVSLSASAIPEPSTYAAIFGVVALGALVVHRRRRAPSA